MSGWNLPPGCSTRDLPGCSADEEKAEALYDSIYEQVGKILGLEDPPDELIKFVQKQMGEAYHLGYAQGMADEVEANRWKGETDGFS